MQGIARLSALLLLILILPITSTIQIIPAEGQIQPGPILNISISNAQRFTNTQNRDFQPAVIQGLDGTAWVFWEYVAFNGRSSLPVIDYRTSSNPSPVYNASNWSGNQVLSQTPLSQNVSPSASQFRNGTIYVSFSSNRTGNYNIFLKQYTPGPGWSSDRQATLGNLDQLGSSVVAASDSSLWLFYDRALNPTTSNIFYKVGKGGSWSTETPLTTDASSIQNTQPSAYQMNDGSVWMIYTRTDSATGIGNIYYKIFSNNVWTGPFQLTSGTNSDGHPAISQDSNTTIWVSWSRELPTSGSSFQFDVFYNYSVNGGTSWAGETNLTNDVGCTSPCPEDMNPNFAQMRDGRVYLFWSTNRDPQMYWNLYYATTNPMPFHHVAVTALLASPMKIREAAVPSVSAVITVNVTVANLGTFPESFWLFVKGTNATSRTIAAQFLSLAAGDILPLSIQWNTNGIPPARYRLSANVVIPATEKQIVTGDNIMTGGILWLCPPGDITLDGRVDILDGAAVAYAFGSTPGSPLWNPNADLTGDGIVDILDASIVALWFGTVT